MKAACSFPIDTFQLLRSNDQGQVFGQSSGQVLKFHRYVAGFQTQADDAVF